MNEKRVFRSDDLGALIGEYIEVSWQKVGQGVLEVLAEMEGSEQLAAMTPEELIEMGYAQGAGHLLMALLASEVWVDLIPRREGVKKIRRSTRRRRNVTPEG